MGPRGGRFGRCGGGYPWVGSHAVERSVEIPAGVVSRTLESQIKAVRGGVAVAPLDVPVGRRAPGTGRSGGCRVLGYEEEVEQLYQEASQVRAEIEELWLEAQAADVEMKGAVSAAQIHDLSESERSFAVSFGLQNAEKWHTLSELSLRLGNLIETIEEKKAARARHGSDADGPSA